MSKRLNTDNLQNELAGSAFFQPRPNPPGGTTTQDKEHSPTSPTRKQKEPAKIQPSIGRAAGRPTERPALKRTAARVSFEFYVDQVERLKRFSLEDQLQGEKGNMSQMVREAVDTYI